MNPNTGARDPAWMDLSGAIAAAGPATSWIDTVTAATMQRFYMVYGVN